MSTGRPRIRRQTGRRIHENGNHEPNLCIVQNEASEEWSFQGDNNQDEFCEWFTILKTMTAISSFNIYANTVSITLAQRKNYAGPEKEKIYLYMHNNHYDVITKMCSAKVLSLTVELFHIRFIDLLNFIPTRLANFLKTFGIEELAKGYFPHLFNRKENESYVGPFHHRLTTTPMV